VKERGKEREKAKEREGDCIRASADHS